MADAEKIVDGFHFMPPSLRAWLSKDIPKEAFRGYIPWTPLKRPLMETTLSLMTSAGISMKNDPPFDVEREKESPHGAIRPAEISPEMHPSKTLKSTICTSTRITSKRI